MTVLTTTPAARTAWAPIEQEFGELFTYQENLERALEQTFAELQQWRSSLAEQEQRLVQQQAALESDRQSIQCDRQSSLLSADAAVQQLVQTKHELLATQAELAQLRAANESAERQLSELARGDSPQQSPDHDSPDHNTLVAEREELELELENIRARAAQLSDTLAETRRQLVQERQQWNHERQVLRSEIEDLRARGPAQPVAATPELSSNSPVDANDAWRAAPGSPTVRPPEDVVLGSVLAQFQKLGDDRRARQKRAC